MSTILIRSKELPNIDAETWIWGCDIETKGQSSLGKRPEEPWPQKTRQVLSNVKVLLIIFFDYNRVVHSVFLLEKSNINKENFTIEVMRRVK